MTITRSSIAQLALLVCPAALAAQGSRVAVSGRVVDAAGRPVAQAEVVLQRRAGPGAAQPERETLRSDARGRFRARVPVGAACSAWARWRQPQGAWTWSEVVNDIGAKRRVELRQAEHGTIDVRLQVVGRELWEGQGAPLRVVRVDSDGRRREIALARDGETLLEASAGARTSLEFFHGDTLVHTSSIACTSAGRNSVRARLREERAKESGTHVPGLPELRRLALPELDVARVVLPVPIVLPLQLVDAKTQKGLAGARLIRPESTFTATYEAQREVGETDAQGRAEVLIPLYVDSWGATQDSASFTVHALARGRALALAGWEGPGRSNNLPKLDKAQFAKALETHRLPRVVVEAKPLEAARVRVRCEDMSRARGLSILARVSALGDIRNGTSYAISGDVLFAMDAEGEVELVGVGAHHVPTLEAAILLPPAACAPGDAAAIPTLRWLELPPSSAREMRLDLGTLEFTTLQIKGTDRRPASAVELTVEGERRAFTQHRESEGVYALQHVRSDRRGRCRVPSVAGAGKRYVIARNDEGYFVGALDELPLVQTRDGARGAPLRQLALRPFTVVRGRVVDENDEPAPDAWVYAMSSQLGSSEERPRRIVKRLNDSLLQARTNARGRFTIRYIPIEGAEYSVGALVQVGATTLSTNDATELPRESAEIVIRLPGKLPAAKGK